jgi:ABC-2 type transport system ATP-binding protein
VSHDGEVKPAAVIVRNLRVVRGRRVALDGVSLIVAPGTVTGLLGPSGSGKTTLMRSLVGVQRSADGEVTILGAAAGSASLRPLVGYVTQTPSVYADLTVAENLGYFARILRASPPRVAAVVDETDLGDHERQLVRDLSGGERARVSLATALLNEPRLLVLDEPTVGLDPVLRRDLWALFHRLAAAGTTLFVSSHVMDEAAQCDDLVLLRDGNVVYQGSPDALRGETGQHDLNDAFLALIERAR